MMLIDPRINPVACRYCLLKLMLYGINTYEIASKGWQFVMACRGVISHLIKTNFVLIDG